MITFENAERCHKRLWDWLAKTGAAEKFFWPEFSKRNRHGKIIKKPMNLCFACEIIMISDRVGPDCNRCPITWIKDRVRDLQCCYDGSPFKKWDHAVTTKDRKQYAAIIRDLPWVRR